MVKYLISSTSSQKCSKNIILRHYSVWLIKNEMGFGLKILSVIDKDGIFIQSGEPLDPDKAVLQLREIIPNSPAHQSGIMRVGDVFLKINDAEIREITHSQALKMMNDFPIGTTVKFLMSRAMFKNDSGMSMSAEAYGKIGRSRTKSISTNPTLYSNNNLLTGNIKINLESISQLNIKENININSKTNLSDNIELQSEKLNHFNNDLGKYMLKVLYLTITV